MFIPIIDNSVYYNETYSWKQLSLEFAFLTSSLCVREQEEKELSGFPPSCCSELLCGCWQTGRAELVSVHSDVNNMASA